MFSNSQILDTTGKLLQQLRPDLEEVLARHLVGFGVSPRIVSTNCSADVRDRVIHMTVTIELGALSYGRREGLGTEDPTGLGSLFRNTTLNPEFLEPTGKGDSGEKE